jgi:drug/metabolite transporter (DMT)-like permease
VDAVTLIMYRMLFALPIFAVMAWWASRGKAALTRKDWLGVLWLGFTGYYLASFLDFAGLAFISASLERLILYLNPTLVLLLGLVMYKRRVSAPQIIGMAISYCGVVLVFGHEIDCPHAPPLRVGRCPPRGRCACGLAKPVPRPLLV